MKQSYNFLYETNARGSYLVLRHANEGIIKYQLEMIMNNQIPYIAPLHARYQDGEVFISYYITSKQPLPKLLERNKLTLSQLLEILQGICRALLEAHVYLLNEDNFLLDFQHLYVNPATFEVSLVYLPLEVNKIEDDAGLRQLFNKLLLYVAAEDSSNSSIHNLLLHINKADFSIGGFLNTVSDIKLKLSSLEAIDPQPENPLKEYCKPDNKLSDGSVLKRLNTSQKFKTGKAKLILFFSQILMLVTILLLFFEEAAGVRRAGEIDWLRFGGIALLLGVFDYLVIKKLLKNSCTEAARPLQRQRVSPDGKRQSCVNDTQLVRLEDSAFLYIMNKGIKERAAISKASFIIGKLKEQVDLMLESKAISRLHAEITCVEGVYYIKDLNSRNGTFLNGERIESNKNYLLSNGDSIDFADQSCSFQKNEAQALKQG